MSDLASEDFTPIARKAIQAATDLRGAELEEEAESLAATFAMAASARTDELQATHQPTTNH